jgi:hypothetical protein
MTITFDFTGSYVKPSQCAVCNKNTGLLLCGRCQKVHYCSRACQKTAWNTHKIVCQQPTEFKMSDGSVYKIEDGGALSYAVIRLPVDENNTVPIWTHLELEESGKEEDKKLAALMKEAYSKWAGPSVAIVRPCYVKTLNGDYLYSSGTNERIVMFPSHLYKWENTLRHQNAELKFEFIYKDNNISGSL